MRLLDLFCGAGGSARGYQDAGFYVVGVDIEDQPNYCGDEFYQGDALEFPSWARRTNPGWWNEFDLIHASPPCQAYSRSTRDHGAHPDLVGSTRELLEASGRPYVIENVPGSPLQASLKLCGSAFGLGVQRHRIFELSGFDVWVPPTCDHDSFGDDEPWQVTGKLGGRDYHSVRHRKPSLERGKKLMAMPWVETDRELSEAIPPAYTKVIGEQFISQQVAV